MGCTRDYAKNVHRGPKLLGLVGIDEEYLHVRHVCAGKGILECDETLLSLDCSGDYMTLDSV